MELPVRLHYEMAGQRRLTCEGVLPFPTGKRSSKEKKQLRKKQKNKQSQWKKKKKKKKKGMD